MDKATGEAIKNIVWFIPNKKLRNSVRHLLIKKFEIDDRLDTIENILSYNFSNSSYIIKCIRGGLADQIKHYISGRIIELEYGRKIKYDISSYGENINGTRNSNRNFELTNLFPHLKLEIASNEEILEYKKLCTSINYNINDVLKFIKYRPMYLSYEMLVCYFQMDNKKNIIQTIKQELDFDKAVYPLLKGENLNYYNEIQSAKFSIGIHVRRGDWIEETKNYDGLKVPDENYFIEAINLLKNKIEHENIKLFFFSDDMDWVKSKLIPKISKNYDYTLIENNDDKAGYIDFYLLMNTMHQIGGLGSFYKLAYFFCKNKEKMIVLQNNNNKPKIDKDFIL